MAFTPSPVLKTSTLDAYLRVKVEPIFRKSKLVGGLKAHGRLKMNHSGKKTKWTPRVRRRKLQTLDPYNVVVSFPSVNTRMEVSLDMKVYGLGERLSKMDKLANRGKETQLWNLAQEILDHGAEDFNADFGSKLYLDGNETGSRNLDGLETPMSVDGTLSGGFVGDPDGSYAGKSCALGFLGGDWDDDYVWPLGQGDEDYHAWSPMVVDTQNVLWDATTKTWINTWPEVLNFAMAYQGRLYGEEPDIFLCNTEFLRQAKNSLRDKERFIATPKSKLTDVGFKTVMFENLEIMDEYNVPEGAGYLLRWDALQLLSMQGQLVGFEKDFEIRSADELFRFDFFGNLKIESPSAIAKVTAITTGT